MQQCETVSSQWLDLNGWLVAWPEWLTCCSGHTVGRWYPCGLTWMGLQCRTWVSEWKHKPAPGILTRSAVPSLYPSLYSTVSISSCTSSVLLIMVWPLLTAQLLATRRLDYTRSKHTKKVQTNAYLDYTVIFRVSCTTTENYPSGLVIFRVCCTTNNNQSSWLSHFPCLLYHK